MPHKLVTNQIRGAFSGTNALWGGGSRLLHNGSGSGVINPARENSNAVNDEGTGNPTSFYRRQSNSVNYHSPQWGGFQLQGAFSSGNEGTGLGMSPLQPRLYSLAGHFNSGPLYVGASFERHSDYNPANVSVLRPTVAPNGTGGPGGTYSGGDDDSWQIGAGYTFAGVFKLTGMYTANKYEVNNTSEVKTKGFAVYGDWKVAGPHIVRAAYAKLQDTKGNGTNNAGSYIGPGRGLACGPASTASCASDTGADWFSIHYAYTFSKRTEGVVAFNRIANDQNAAIGMGKSTPTRGGTQTSIGVGLKHRF
jgi:predicted porin